MAFKQNLVILLTNLCMFGFLTLLVALSTATSTNLDALCSYITAQGGLLGSVTVAAIDGLRGLSTTRAVRAGEELFAIPAHLALVDMDALASEGAASALCKRAAIEHEHELMAVALLHRLRSGTVPALLTASLPALEDFVPGPTWLWTEAELAALASPQLAGLSRWRRDECERLHRDIEPLWIASGCFGSPPSLREVTWAVAIATSRMLSAVSEATGDTLPVLLPVADLMNHDPHGKGVRFTLESVKESGATSAAIQGNQRQSTAISGGRSAAASASRYQYVCRSVGDLPAGAPVTFSYDTRAPNAHLLLHFGFMLPSNPYEIIEIDMMPLFEQCPRDAIERCVHAGLLEGRVGVEGATGGVQTRRLQELSPRLREAVRLLVHAAAAQDEDDSETDDERLRIRADEALAGLLQETLRTLEEHEAPAAELPATSTGVSVLRARVAAAFRRSRQEQLRIELAQLQRQDSA